METDFLKMPVSTQIAIISFAIGTFLFGLYFSFKNSEILIYTGILYIFIAGIVNGIMLLKLVYDWITIPTKRADLKIQIIIVLANLPIAFLYILIIIYNAISDSPF
ncbi:hypothetical protein [Flavobacterium channae]|uniref:hypothetical protein n=1 Tax=Flavobacterium channae TaxID=2897181 RepID=UPI001E34E387|nr:hypothetical protein [Flavobacterium channae]UGS22428.1 hypothetical protein LOS89_06475 [Flavobacterium channae]